MNIRNISLAVIALSAYFYAGAQKTPAEFKNELAQPDPLYNSRVVVNEPESIKSLLDRTWNTSERIKGYRVRIFLDNRQTARSGANETERKFKEIFPDVPCYSDYYELYFRVTVGDCITQDEVQMLLAKVVREFPNAFRVVEDIPLSNFIVKPGADTPQEEGKEEEGRIND